jgi:hypothetical protein
MNTTNQIKTFARSNQYIKQYLAAGAYYTHQLYNKLGRNVSILGRIKIDLSTYQKNEMYCRAHKEAFFKFKNIESYMHKHFSVNIDGLNFGGWFHLDISGKAFILLNSCSYGDKTANKLPFINKHSYSFAYNGKINDLSIQTAIINEIEKHLFAPGLFRNIQLCKYYTKEQAKQFYLTAIKQRKEQPEIYCSDSTHKSILRHLNIFTEYIHDEKFFKVAKRLKKQHKPTAVEMFDLSILDDFEGDIDEAESIVYESMRPGTIYI